MYSWPLEGKTLYVYGSHFPPKKDPPKERAYDQISHFLGAGESHCPFNTGRKCIPAGTLTRGARPAKVKHFMMCEVGQHLPLEEAHF